MELRPRIKYSSEEELQKWEELLNKAREEGPDSILIQYEGDECVFEGPFRTVEDVMKYHKIDPEKYIGKPVESTYWEVTMKTDEGHVTVPNHRLKVKIVPKPLEVIQFKEFAEGLPKYEKKESTGDTLNVFIGDIHAGAVSRGYNLKKIVELLSETSAEINKTGSGCVNINLVGDIFESISGMSHPDTWKNIEMHGAELIKETSKIVSSFLKSISNLSKVRIVGGNHDRFNKDRKDGNDGDAANIIAYILEVMGFDVEFNSNQITYNCGGIRYIIEHGDKALSKRDPYEKIFKDGQQGMFNILLKAHDHTRKIGRSYDGSSYRQITIPSFIPNSAFGDSLGLEGTSGFVTIKDNGFKKPLVIDYTL